MEVRAFKAGDQLRKCHKIQIPSIHRQSYICIEHLICDRPYTEDTEVTNIHSLKEETDKQTGSYFTLWLSAEIGNRAALRMGT